MRRPNLKTLYVFDAAARHLNFRLASEELNVTQGAVAQQVRQLESDLDIKLFERLARGLALTKKGRDYHQSIQQALSLIDQATKDVSPRYQSTDVNLINLSVTPSLASKWLVPRLANFSKQYPDIQVEIIASETCANFQSDGVDIAIRQGEPPFGEGISHQYFSAIELIAVAAPEYAEELTPINKIEDFAALNLIEDGHQHWRKLFVENDINHKPDVVKFNQTALAMDMATSGQGIALVPKLLLGDALETQKLVSLWEFTNKDPIAFYIVYLKTNNPKTATIMTLIDWLLGTRNKE